MRFGLDRKRACLTAMAVVALCLIMVSDGQSVPRLKVTVGDTTGSSGEQNSVVTVFLQNTLDQVAAFDLYLQLSRPDICLFQTDMDTVVDTTYWFCSEWDGEVCVDSISDTLPNDPPPYDFFHIDTVEAFVGNVDTAGTLISGWELVTSRSSNGIGTDIKVSAIANRLSVPGNPPPISPGSGVLFRLLADILPIPDTMLDRTVSIIPQPFVNYFSFSRPDGTAIGIKTVLVPDTSFFICRTWSVPPFTGCADYDRVPPYECGTGGCDSIYVEMVTLGVFDSDSVQMVPGSLTVETWGCGDLNSSGFVSVTDIGIMVDYMFIKGAYDPYHNPTGVIIDPIERANCNCSTEYPVDITIGDISAIVDRLFISQQPMCCEH